MVMIDTSSVDSSVKVLTLSFDMAWDIYGRRQKEGWGDRGLSDRADRAVPSGVAVAKYRPR